MTLRWYHDWGCDFPTSSYADDASWGISNLGNIVTNNKTNLASPADPTRTPSEQTNCRIEGTDVVSTPVFPGAPLTQGWYLTRWRFSPGNSLNDAGGTGILFLKDGASTNVIVLKAADDGNPVPLKLIVNGSLVGTTTRTFGDASFYVLAVDFDLSASPPEAGLVADGVREIVRSGGGVGSTSIDRAQLLGGGLINSTEGFHGVQLLFDDLADPGDNPNFWGTALNSTSVIDPDASWSIVGGAGSKTEAVADRDLATGDQTTTDPDTISVGFQALGDILTGWSPTNILGLGAIAIGNADVLNNTTVDLRDGTGVAGSTSDVLTATQKMLSVLSVTDSVAASWTPTTVDAATVDYSVSS